MNCEILIIYDSFWDFYIAFLSVNPTGEYNEQVRNSVEERFSGTYSTGGEVNRALIFCYYFYA